MSSFFSSLILLLLLLVNPAHSRSRHVINLSSSNLRPSSLAWDPDLQHFLVGSDHLPLISAVSDAGVVQTVVSAAVSSSSYVSAIAVDERRRRLIVAFSSPAAVSVFDLRSPPPHTLLFTSFISDAASGVSVDPATGKVFLASSDRIVTVDLQGNVSLLAQLSGRNLGGLAHVSKGFLLVVDRSDGGGKILKVDDEDGTIRRTTILTSNSVLDAAEMVAVRRDEAAVVAGGGRARWLTSKDGWSECAVYDEFGVREEEGESVVGVAVRERKRFYVLVRGKEGGSRIEEAEWGREGEGEMVGLLVLVGLGMAYFMYWRFQMGKLVSSINRKRE